MTDKDEVAKTAIRLKRAILTLAKVPDPDRRFVYGSTTYWPDVVQSFSEAYGYTVTEPTAYAAFEPSPKDIDTYLDTLDHLTWLEKQPGGKRDSKIIVARAFKVSWWKIAQEFGRHERTIQRWYDGAVTVIHENCQKSTTF